MQDSTADHSSAAPPDIPPHAEMLTARRAAWNIISAIIEKRRTLDEALAMDEDFRDLPVRDRAFVRMIVATTLRRRGQIDDMIGRATKRDEPPNPPAIFNLLRMGVAQLVFMDVQDYAVVDTAVRLAADEGFARQKGFVNAVLRETGRNCKDWLTKQDETRLNTPGWLMRIWIEDYGLRSAADIAGANLTEAPLDITLKDERESGHWQKALDASRLPSGSLRRLEGGRVSALPGFEDGAWWVQDASAALPVKLMGDVSGARIVDLCAAPGGKTAQLAAAGAYVTALDRSVKRLETLRDNLHRLGLEENVTVEAADGAVWTPQAPVDAVLLDAPCTATGTVRRNPDILYLKKPQDMERLITVQARLLDNAFRMLKPGGILIYCTCSLQKAEGEEQVSAFLERTPGASILPVRAEETGGIEGLVTPDGTVRVLPYHLAAQGGMDGFFIARLLKNNA